VLHTHQQQSSEPRTLVLIALANCSMLECPNPGQLTGSRVASPERCSSHFLPHNGPAMPDAVPFLRPGEWHPCTSATSPAHYHSPLHPKGSPAAEQGPQHIGADRLSDLGHRRVVQQALPGNRARVIDPHVHRAQLLRRIVAQRRHICEKMQKHEQDLMAEHLADIMLGLHRASADMLQEPPISEKAVHRGALNPFTVAVGDVAAKAVHLGASAGPLPQRRRRRRQALLIAPADHNPVATGRELLDSHVQTHCPSETRLKSARADVYMAE